MSSRMKGPGSSGCLLVNHLNAVYFTYVSHSNAVYYSTYELYLHLNVVYSTCITLKCCTVRVLHLYCISLIGYILHSNAVYMRKWCIVYLYLTQMLYTSLKWCILHPYLTQKLYYTSLKWCTSLIS